MTITCLACSYLSVKEPQQAIRLLASRPDMSTQRVAIEIAALTYDADALRSHGQKYISRCLLQYDWLLARDLISIHPSLLVRSDVEDPKYLCSFFYIVNVSWSYV